VYSKLLLQLIFKKPFVYEFACRVLYENYSFGWPHAVMSFQLVRTNQKGGKKSLDFTDGMQFLQTPLFLCPSI